ncbi:MAG: polysaccharide deacetylase family protein [Oscillospiraceae bacterium]
MVIKINYNIVAVVLGVLFCFCFFFAEYVTDSVKTKAVVGEMQIELPVLMYHHILENKNRLGDYVISPAQLESDLKFIKEHNFNTISTAQLSAFLQDGDALPSNPIMITFDDGYESVYKYAYPLLQKYQMKAVVSIIGRYTDLYSDPKTPKHINYSHLNWTQLEEMKNSTTFDVQNHSYNMHANDKKKSRYGIRIIPGESEQHYKESLVDDIGGLSDKIEDKLHIRPQAFAYPFGALCKQSKPILTQLGFKIIFTCEEKINIIKPCSECPVPIKRINRASKYSTEAYFSKFKIK